MMEPILDLTWTTAVVEVVAPGDASSTDQSAVPSSSSIPKPHLEPSGLVLEFRAFCDVNSNTAGFSLRASIVGQNVPSRPRRQQRTNKPVVYLLIRPEQINTLVDDSSRKPPGPQSRVIARASNVDLSPRDNTVCLVFTLKDPAVLVAGPDQKDSEIQKDDNLVLRLAMSLAQQTTLAVHVVRDVLPDAPHLSTICRAVSAPGLLQPSRHVDPASMYRGKSGRVISVPFATNENDHHQEDYTGATAGLGLPAYEELTDAPPPPAPTAASVAETLRKRARTLSDSIEYQNPHEQPVPPAMTKMCEAVIARQFSEAYGRFQADVQQQFKQELQLLEKRLMGHIDRQSHTTGDLRRKIDELDGLKNLIHTQLERTDALRTQVAEKLQQYEKAEETARQDLEQEVSRLHDMHDGLEGQLADLHRHLEDHLDEEIEEKTTSAKIDLQDFVQDEVQNAQEAIEQKLQDGVFMIGGMVQVSR